MNQTRFNRTRGFTLIELLIVVAIIGIIAAFAVPNLLGAMDRGRQTKTVADIKRLGDAIALYAIDHQSRYPQAKDMQSLVTDLQPKYMPKVPVTDAWGHPLIFEPGEKGTSYTIRSLGKDGEPQDAPVGTTTGSFDDDIVWTSDTFAQAPDSNQ